MEADEREAIRAAIQRYQRIFNPLTYILLGVVVAANTLIISAFFKYRRLRSITNRFVVSLAVADLCVGLTRTVQELVEYIDLRDVTDTTLTYRKQFFITIPVTMNVASLLCLLGVTIDRYISVINPLRYVSIMTGKLANCIIAGSWFLAIGVIYLASHYFYLWPARDPNSADAISRLYRYTLTTYFSLFVSLLLVISLFYLRIFYACHKHQLMALVSKDFSERVASQQLIASPTIRTGSGTSTQVPMKTSKEEDELVSPRDDTFSNVPRDPDKQLIDKGSYEARDSDNCDPNPKRICGILKNSNNGGQALNKLDNNNGTVNTLIPSPSRVKLSQDEPNSSRTGSGGLVKKSKSRGISMSSKGSGGLRIASKSTIMIAMIVGTFAALSIPLQVVEYILIYQQSSISNFKTFYVMDGLCVLLYYSHSAFNFYIYAWKNGDFRQAFKRILTCGRRQRDPYSNQTWETRN